MKKLFYLNSRLIKFAWLILLVAGFGGAAFGATFTVTKIADTNDGVCDADCSLREAINVANNSIANDTIIFSSLFNSPQTITLSGNQLIIANNGTLDISGPDLDFLTISANRNSRVFLINSGAIATFNNLRIIRGNGNDGDFGGGIAVGGQLTVNSSIIEDNGPYSTGLTNDGGGVYVYNSALFNLNNSIVQNNSVRIGGAGISTFGTINITDSIIRNNTANDNGGGIRAVGTANIVNSLISNNRVNLISSGGGGGIYNIGSNSTMTISNSTISGNTSNDNGGGITNTLNATLTINNSTISSNSTVINPGSSGGGGIYNSGGLLTLNNSVINDNSTTSTNTDGGGGGIYNNSFGTLMLTNLTISNNRANSGRGGGIYNTSGTTNLTNVTVVDNQADSNLNNQGGGGGILNRFSTLNIRNSIIANNNDSSGITPDFSGNLVSQGYNLIENTAGTTITGTTTGNILGRDPQLAPLRNNGGVTQTVALQAGSPAVDAADPANFPATDQRGIARPQDGDLNGSALPDIGAYERQATAFTVTKTADSNDGVCNADCSLREAIAAANAAATLDNAVVLNAGVFGTPQTLTLMNGELQINNSGGTFAVIGTGANSLTISANNQSRIFFISSGANVTLSGMRITGGNTTTNGGSIYNAGRLTVNNATITGNTAANFGGGIFNNDVATLNVINSTIGSNSASVGGGIFSFTNSNLSVTGSTVSGNNSSSGYGGGISNNAGTLLLNNSTISGNGGSGIYNGGVANVNNSTVSGNSAPNGGGIFNDVFLNITNSTVARNTAGNQGGGIFRNAGTVTSRNSIIADNAAANSAPDYSGALTSQGYNLIENISGATITGTTVGNISGQDPQLLPLADNGGATQTHALRLNSPAIDKGNSFGVNTDQRGQFRPFDFPNISNSSGGNGADIGAFERQPIDRSGSTLFDFDGDGKADVSVFRPSNGTWYLQQSAAGFTGVSFGQSEDKIVPGDYDGDGKTDVAVFRSGIWYLQRSQLGFIGITFGEAGDTPVPADYDGDGKTDVAVFRPSNGTWYLLRSSAGFVGVAFGQSGDSPVAADYDGDGQTDVAVFRAGTWYILRSQHGFTGVVFGEATDKPAPGDYDGDGKTDVAVFRPSNGTWYLQRSQAGFVGIAFGLGSDLPVPADYDGDGKADVAVFRDGAWYLNRSAQGFSGVSFGATADRPAPSAFIP